MTLDDVFSWGELLYIAFYVILIFGVPGAVAWGSYSTYGLLNKFDMSELWLHQGRVDKFAVILLGTWWIHSASMIMWTLIKQVQTQDYVTYMGWALPIIAKMFAPRSDNEVHPTTKT